MNATDSVRSLLSTVAAPALALTVFAAVSFPLSNSLAAGVCESAFRTEAAVVRKSEPKPKIEIVANTLAQLSLEDQQHFIQTDWGDPISQLVPDAESFGYKQYLIDSYSKPTPFTNKENERAGGIVAYHGHIFPEGFWRLNGHSSAEGSAPLTRKEAQVKQPWLEWNSQSNSYVIRHGNTVGALLAPYIKNGKARIYRGVDSRGLEMLKRIKAGDHSMLTADTFGYTDALFFSPDSIVATRFSTDEGGGYVELDLDLKDFNKAYGGIEWFYVEIALSPAALLASIDSLIIHEAKKSAIAP